MEIFGVLVAVIVFVNLILYTKLSDVVVRLEDTLTDVEITYTKLQQMTRDIKDVFTVHKME